MEVAGEQPEIERGILEFLRALNTDDTSYFSIVKFWRETNNPTMYDSYNPS